MGPSGDVVNSLVHLKGIIELHPHFVVMGLHPLNKMKPKKCTFHIFMEHNVFLSQQQRYNFL
jgi:hypothetical protein